MLRFRYKIYNERLLKIKLVFNIFELWATFFADSTVLAYVLKTLNERYNYGVELMLLSIDEGITGYRDDSLEVKSVFDL